jgi:two-component system, NarL family, response regulator DevR
MAMMADPENPPQHSLAGRGVYILDDHEIVRRGLRQLLGSDGLRIAGESGAARVAVRRTPALRPALVIVDDDLPDGSGAEVCRAIAAADPAIRCVLMTDNSDEAVLIDSILSGAWGCLSKQDDGSEQLRLIRRALAGHTAYSGRFQPALLAPSTPPGPLRLDKRLLTLTRQEMNAAIGLGKGLSNRQISKEMVLAEKTVKNLVSSLLAKLGMARRTEAAVLITRAMSPSEDPADGDFRSSLYPDLIAEVTAALLNCTSESRGVPLTDELRARYAGRLADALTAVRTGRRGLRPLQSRT